MRIAFIGLGHMGGPMAINLARGGHDVVGFDLVQAATESARASGVTIAESAAAAVAGAEVVITMLPAGRHVLSAYAGSAEAPGLLASAAPGTLFIDSSTIAVDDARQAHDLALAAGHRAMDAPVSGGTVGAEAGTLAFMVGGSDEDFAVAEPILAITMIGVSEAFVLGEKLGLTNQALFDVASNASGQCWALTTNCPVPGPVPTSPANRDYRPGFAGALMAKDLGLAEQAITSTGVHAEIGLLAAAIYRRFADGAGAGLDFSGIIDDIRVSSEEGVAA